MALIGFNLVGDIKEGDAAFVIGGNLCNALKMGARDGTDYWLEGNVVEGEFVFNGRLFLPGGGAAGHLVDSFPKAEPDTGWARHQRIEPEGYDLVAPNGTTLFGFEVREPRLCFITVNIFAADGSVVAKNTPEGLVINRGPAELGHGDLVM